MLTPQSCCLVVYMSPIFAYETTPGDLHVIGTNPPTFTSASPFRLLSRKSWMIGLRLPQLLWPCV